MTRLGSISWIGNQVNPSSCLGLNELNQCLIPYKSSVPNETNVTTETNYCLISLTLNDFVLLPFVESFQSLKIEKDEDWGDLVSIHTIDNHFFVSCVNKTVRINPHMDSIHSVIAFIQFLLDSYILV